MPITVLPIPTPLAWGPGVPFQMQSDFIGPLPTGAYWEVTVRNHIAETVVGTQTIPALSGAQQAQWWVEYTGGGLSNVNYAPQDGDQVDVTVKLMQDPQTSLDQGVSSPFPWTSTRFLWTTIPQTTQQGQAGFTESDRTVIQQTQQLAVQSQDNWTQYEQVTLPSLQDMLNNITSAVTTVLTGVGGAVSSTIGALWSGKTLDLLTETPIGTACFPDIIQSGLIGGPIYGLNARCTSFAPWYVWTGPGDSYSTQSLGTLEIKRGGSLALRVGLHTVTHLVYPLPDIPALPIEIDVPLAPFGYEVTLTPAPETCWELFALDLP